VRRLPPAVASRTGPGRRAEYALQLALVVALTGVAVAVMPSGAAVDGGAARKLFLLGRMAGLVLLCSALLRRGGERWADLGLRRPGRWWAPPLLALGGFLLLVVLATLEQRRLLPALGLAPPRLRAVPAFAADPAEFLFWAGPVAWGSAAFGEELLARGFILDRIAKVLGASGTGATLAAVLLQAAVFGALHAPQGAGGALLTGTAGLVLGLVWLAGGRNLWAGILLHGAVDSLAASGR
jgi:membrane protease YdiL (CAAX protease family)